MNIFKRYSWVPAVLFFFITASLSHADVVDRIVAVVNDDVITLSEVNQEGKAYFTQVATKAPAEERENALKKARKSVIKRLIERRILIQEANRLKISIKAEEVEAALQQILRNNKTTYEQFQQNLQKVGMSEEQYRENLSNQILGTKLVTQEVKSKIIISEEQVIDFYDNNYSSQVYDGDFYLLQIGTSWEQHKEQDKLIASQTEALKKAERVHSLAVGGQDFKELARKYSDFPSATDGGDIGVFKKNEMAAYMLDAISSIKPGEISQVVETPSGYQFFKLLSSREGKVITKAPYETVRKEIYDLLYKQQVKNRYNNWIRGIEETSYIKVL